MKLANVTSTTGKGLAILAAGLLATCSMGNPPSKTKEQIKEYDDIKEACSYRSRFFALAENFQGNKLQYKIDSIEYRIFFEKHNLLDSINFAKFKEIAKKIKP